MRRQFPAWDSAIAVHHSSLAASRRQQVESGLKDGHLRAVVSSTSLELGIDIGRVDAVVLVHPPGDVVRLLQRVGRSGHGPGRAKRGLVLTASAGELLEATVTAASTRSAQYEPIRIPSHPLDVLCQQLAGMAASRSWTAEEAFALVGRAHPYRDLPRDDFDACLDYLSGRRREPGTACFSQWLPARLAWDGPAFRIVDERTVRLLRRNIGTILTEVARPVVLESEARDRQTIGEVDEPFAEHLQAGDRFLLDGRCLEYRRDDDRELLVQEVIGRPAVPRWGSEGRPLSADLACRLYLLRVQAAEALRSGRAELLSLLQDDQRLGPDAAAALADYIERQESASEVPDTGACLVEVVSRQGATDHYLHTPLNRAGNGALTRVAVLRLTRDFGRASHSLVADLGWMLSVAGAALQPGDWRQLLSVERFAADLNEALAESPALRTRFQRVALTGLMLLRHPLGRTPRVGGRDWGERRLFDRVRRGDPTFVLLRQARRELLREVCDAQSAEGYVAGLANRGIRCRRLAGPSPFVQAWGPVEAGPAELIETPDEALRRLHAALTGAA